MMSRINGEDNRKALDMVWRENGKLKEERKRVCICMMGDRGDFAKLSTGRVGRKMKQEEEERAGS